MKGISSLEIAASVANNIDSRKKEQLIDLQKHGITFVLVDSSGNIVRVPPEEVFIQPDEPVLMIPDDDEIILAATKHIKDIHIGLAEAVMNDTLSGSSGHKIIHDDLYNLHASKMEEIKTRNMFEAKQKINHPHGWYQKFEKRKR